MGCSDEVIKLLETNSKKIFCQLHKITVKNVADYESGDPLSAESLEKPNSTATKCFNHSKAKVKSAGSNRLTCSRWGWHGPPTQWMKSAGPWFRRALRQTRARPFGTWRLFPSSLPLCFSRYPREHPGRWRLQFQGLLSWKGHFHKALRMLSWQWTLAPSLQ